MFRALDYINYDNLKINRNEKSSETQTDPLSMLDLCCRAINCHPVLAELTLKSVPTHLAPTLLRAAVNFRQLPAVSSILSNWPLPYLGYNIFGLMFVFMKNRTLDLFSFPTPTSIWWHQRNINDNKHTKCQDDSYWTYI